MSNNLRMNASLTAEHVASIKKLLWLGEHQSEIASLYGVSQATISRILHGKSWNKISWPDGSQGPMPLVRAKELKGRAFRGESAPRPTVGPVPADPTTATSDEIEQYIGPLGEAQLQISDEDYEEIRGVLDSAMSDQLKSAVKVGEKPRSGKKRKPAKLVVNPRLKWERVVKLAPGNKWVAAAKEETGKRGEHLKLAICETFSRLDRERWSSDYAGKMILATLEILEEGE